VKAQQHVYVGYDNGSKSVIYYNTPTWKILISRNYQYLTPTESTPLENIIIEPPTPMHEGESEGSMHVEKAPEAEHDMRMNLKRKAEEDPSDTQKIQGKASSQRMCSMPGPQLYRNAFTCG
jgi:hypothetical protein